MKEIAEAVALQTLQLIREQLEQGARVTECTVVDDDEGQRLVLRWGLPAEEASLAPAFTFQVVGSCPGCGSRAREVTDDGPFCADCGAELPPG